MNDPSTAIPEASLLAALASRRPDAAAIGQRVHAKLHQAEAPCASLAPQPKGWSLDGWIRAAAALLPAGLSPAAFAGVATKQAAMKGVLGKTLGLTLLPLFVLGFAIAGFTSAVTRTTGLQGDRSRIENDQEGKRALVRWLGEHWMVAVFSILLIAGLMLLSPLDGAVFGIGAMMISTATVARRLSAQGLADRKSLGAHVFATAIQLFFILSFLATLPKQPSQAAVFDLTAWLIFIGTALTISPFQPRRWFARKAPLTPKLRRLDGSVSFLLALAGTTCWTFLFVGNGTLVRHREVFEDSEFNLLDLRLPVAAILSVVYSTVLMARAPMPRPRGRLRSTLRDAYPSDE